ADCPLGAEEGAVPELPGAVVDLVEVHVLHLGVLEDTLEAELAADAALLVAAERGGDREQMVLVDPHRARAHLLRHHERLLLVPRPHRTAEADSAALSAAAKTRAAPARKTGAGEKTGPDGAPLPTTGRSAATGFVFAELAPRPRVLLFLNRGATLVLTDMRAIEPKTVSC